MRDIELANYMADHHRCYLVIHVQMMGCEVERIYRIYPQEKKHFRPTATWAIDAACRQALRDVKACGIWANWDEERDGSVLKEISQRIFMELDYLRKNRSEYRRNPKPPIFRFQT